MEFLEGCAEGVSRLIAVFHCYVNDFLSAFPQVHHSL